MGNKKTRLGVSRVVRGTYAGEGNLGGTHVTKRKHTIGQVEKDQAEMKQRRATKLAGKYSSSSIVAYSSDRLTYNYRSKELARATQERDCAASRCTGWRVVRSSYVIRCR